MINYTINLNREVWEGWTVGDFIEELSDVIDLIMSGESYVKPFKTESEMVSYIIENQPYYKQPIPEVNAYFINKYGYMLGGRC